MTRTLWRIEKLTEEQERYLPIFRREWLERGLATGPCDRPAVEAAVRKLYEAAGRSRQVS